MHKPFVCSLPDMAVLMMICFLFAAPIRPLKLRVARLEKLPRRFPLLGGDPASSQGLPYVSLELAWDRPPEFANKQGQLVYQVSVNS